VAKTPDDMMSAVIGSLAARTGRSLEEWLVLVDASGIDPLDQNAVRRWLRSEHGVPQNSQWAIADAAARAAGWQPPSVEEYIDSQYQGAKAALRPIYDVLAEAIMGLGADVRAEGRGGYTPFVRGRQFAAVAAAAQDRVDLGLRFTDPPASGRLQPSNGPGQATHKVALHAVADVDDEVLRLVRVAYEQCPGAR
jgi:hypothetical protein